MVILNEEKIGRALRIHRACIICEQTQAKPLFTFTYDFLHDVRDVSAEILEQRGWDKDFTSIIVKCSKCGCVYVKDALLPDPSVRPETEIAEQEVSFEAFVKAQAQRDARPNYFDRDDENWIVRNLLVLAAADGRKPISFLDYGAGSGTASATARTFGVSNVVAYDPFFPTYAQELYDLTRHAGIKCENDPDSLGQSGPFDAVIFQSAIEHVMDPRKELCRIYDLMSSGGYFYVNNPIMPLEKELNTLKSATKITKRDKINYYHPFHVNYLTSNEFKKLLVDIGFEVTSICFYPPLPASGLLKLRALLQGVKSAVRTAQNIFHLPYDRYVFVLRKP